MLDRIKRLMGMLHLNQTEFGQEIGYSQSQIGLLLSGKRKVMDRHVIAICERFNVSERWLRTGDGEIYVTPDETEADLEAFRRVLKAKIKRLPPEGQAVVLELCLELQNAIGGIEDKKNTIHAGADGTDRSDGESQGAWMEGMDRKVA